MTKTPALLGLWNSEFTSHLMYDTLLFSATWWPWTLFNRGVNGFSRFVPQQKATGPSSMWSAQGFVASNVLCMHDCICSLVVRHLAMHVYPGGSATQSGFAVANAVCWTWLGALWYIFQGFIWTGKTIASVMTGLCWQPNSTLRPIALLRQISRCRREEIKLYQIPLLLSTSSPDRTRIY